MCYLVAKWFDGVGSVCMRASQGKSLVETMDRLSSQFGHDKLQLVAVSRPSAYGEYAPYSFVNNETEMAEEIAAKYIA